MADYDTLLAVLEERLKAIKERQDKQDANLKDTNANIKWGVMAILALGAKEFVSFLTGGN